MMDKGDYSCTRYISSTYSTGKGQTAAVETNTLGHQNKTGNAISLADLIVDKVHCCYFDEENL